MILALINFLILLVVCAIHIYWAFGGEWGIRAALPTQNESTMFRPGPWLTLLLAILFGGMAVFYLYKVGLMASVNSFIPNWLSQYGLWALAGTFMLRAIGEFHYVGFFKRIHTSRFAQLDTTFYSPLCLLLSINTFLLIYFQSKP